MDGLHGFVDPSTEGHLAGFHLSAVVRDAAARTSAHVPVRVLLVLLGVCSPDGVAGSRGEAIAESLRNRRAVFHGSCTFHTSADRARGPRFSTSSPTLTDVQLLILAQLMRWWFVSLSPAVGSALTVWSLFGILSLPLSLSLSLPSSHPLFLSKINE